jgi:uncharacterized protein with GYD domain
MATYVCLIKWTQKGIENVKDSPKRLADAKKAFKKEGVNLKSFYMTMGPYDMVSIVEAPDDATLARVLLRLGSTGNLSTTTLRAFDESEYREIIGSI